jgi:hypothetical protein
MTGRCRGKRGTPPAGDERAQSQWMSLLRWGVKVVVVVIMETVCYEKSETDASPWPTRSMVRCSCTCPRGVTTHTAATEKRRMESILVESTPRERTLHRTDRSRPGLLPSTAVIFTRRALSIIFSYLHVLTTKPKQCSPPQNKCAGATGCNNMVHWNDMRVQRQAIRDGRLQAIRFYICRLVFLHLQTNVEGAPTMPQR